MIKRIAVFAIVFTLLILPVCVKAQAKTEAIKKTSSVSGDVQSLIKEGDDLYAARDDAKNILKAIDKYKAALEIDQKNFEAVWKISRAYYYYGTKLSEDDKDGRKQTFEKGKHWAQIAMKFDNNKVDGHFWYGVNLGSWGEANGVMKSLSIRHDLEDEMLKAAKLDETYEGAGSYRVLGRLKFRLPGIFGGDNDLSIEYLRKAVKIAPTHTMNYVFLAETLMDEDEYVEAKKLLEKVIAMEPDPRWIPEAKRDKEDAKRLLKEVLEELE
jgi:tetratricopeptide (TPR) repeat protein